PKFGQDPREVSPFDDIRGVGEASSRVLGMAGAVIGSEGVIAGRPGGDIERGAVIGSELTAAANDIDDVAAEPRAAKAYEVWLQPRVDPGKAGVVTSQGKGANREPLGAYEILDRANREPVLVDRVSDREGLPVVNVHNVGITGQPGDQGWIDRGVAALGGGGVLEGV